MKLFILFGAIIFGWLILSQLIAWMITPGKDEDKVVESWFIVFMFPVVLFALGIMFLESELRKLARKFGCEFLFDWFCL